MSRNVIRYTRVSTRGQSLDAQVDALVAGGAIKVTTATEREAGELNGDMCVLGAFQSTGGTRLGQRAGVATAVGGVHQHYSRCRLQKLTAQQWGQQLLKLKDQGLCLAETWAFPRDGCLSARPRSGHRYVISSG